MFFCPLEYVKMTAVQNYYQTLEERNMRAVITVVGKDTVGIFAKVSTFCAERNVNIIGVSQTILEDMFCMMMQITMDESDLAFADFADELAALGNSKHLDIHTMHEDIFNTMHHI